MRWKRFALASVLVLAACAGSPSGDTTVSSSTTPPSGTSPDSTGPSVTSTSQPVAAPVDMVTSAIDDLAERLGVDPRRIRLIESRAVTWPDGSLGCPQTDQEQSQAEVDGYLVLISHEDRLFTYHAGSDGTPFLCPSEEQDGGREFVPPPGFDT